MKTIFMHVAMSVIRLTGLCCIAGAVWLVLFIWGDANPIQLKIFITMLAGGLFIGGVIMTLRPKFIKEALILMISTTTPV